MPEVPLTSNAVYSAIPTVMVDGQLNDKVTTQLLGMKMTEHEAGMSDLELRLSNFGSFSGGIADQVFEDGTILKLGTALIVYAGDVSSPTEIFRGKVTALEANFPGSAPPELILLAEDALQGARMTRRTKNWDSTSLSGIVQQVAEGTLPVADDDDGEWRGQRPPRQHRGKGGEDDRPIADRRGQRAPKYRAVQKLDLRRDTVVAGVSPHPGDIVEPGSRRTWWLHRQRRSCKDMCWTVLYRIAGR